MKIAVIGSGISGLSIAKILNNKHEITIYEKEKEAGGLIKCERIEDCLFHKVGGHVFNSKDKTVHDWFWSFFNKENEFVKAKREAKILLNNQIIGYPIENYIYLLDKHIVQNIIEDLVETTKSPIKSPYDFKSFKDFLINNFGRTLSEIYFIPYNKKIWGIDLSEVPMKWLKGKLPMPNFKEMVTKNILREEETDMVHSFFYYPKEDGSQFIVNRLKEGLDIKYNQNIADKLTFANNEFQIEGISYQKIIFCGDIRKLPKSIVNILIDNDIDVNYIQNLKTNGTSNIFCETDPTPISWLYLPEEFTKAHRIIYTGNFSETNNRGLKRLTCVVEFSGKVAYSEMCEEIKKLPGNLKPLGYNYEESSYIIHDYKTYEEIDKIKKVLETKGIYLLGRFAEWEYYNMDKAIENALTLSYKI